MRKWFSIISALVFLLVILVIAGVWQFKRVLNSFQIQSFHYQLETLNLHRIKFSELSFVHKTETAQQAIELQDFSAEWYWPSWFSPQLSVVSVEQLEVIQTALADAKKSPDEKPLPVFSLPENWSVPDFFPEQVHIQKLIIKLPCVAKGCTLSGLVDILKIKTGQLTTGIDLKLKASPGNLLNAEQQFILDAVYSVEQNLPTANVKLRVDDSINLQLNTHLKRQDEIYWLGSLKGNATYLNDSWLPYLTELGVKFAPQAMEIKSNLLESTAPKLSIDTEWQLALTPLINLPKTAKAADGIKALTGTWVLDTKILTPLLIDNFGEFSGKANIDVDISAGQLNRYALAADVTAQYLVIPDALQTRGIIADTAHLQIESIMNSSVTLNALPVTFSGSTQGALQTNLAGRLLIDTTAKKIIVEQFDLSAKAKNLKPLAGVQLNNVSADLHASGYWQPEKFELNLAAPNQVSADVLAKDLSLTANAAQFSTSQLSLSGDMIQGAVVWPQLKFTAEAQLKGGKFQHPQVQAKTWYWRGKAEGSLTDFEIKGDLGVGSSLLVTHKLNRKASALTMGWSVPDIFLLAGNPFADTVVAWPLLLTLSRGKLNASGNLGVNLEKNSLTKSNTTLQLADVSGVYDTLAIQGLSSQIKIITNANKLNVSTDNITVSNINKGFDFGPLVAAGKYEAAWDKLMQGQLNLQSFSGSVMGGSLTTVAQSFDFSHTKQNITLDIKDVNLANLLKQYSPSEISGTGLLSGSVPIEINSEGIRVAQGVVAAAEPGGLLQLRSERADAMAKSQPSMKLVVDALNDFHYTALASKINYDENGKLLLSINLEGRNPALENGRPINLNVNLEEDVPAMLASIQLSSKVSDIIKKRLQSRIQKNESVKNK